MGENSWKVLVPGTGDLIISNLESKNSLVAFSWSF